MEKKRCIFHIPFYIDRTSPSGTNIRPLKIIAALEAVGYTVDVVMGYGAERKKLIEEIKSKIKAGTKYDFLYSESSTEPTLLTEKNHLPKYPFMDFDFFKFCKRSGMKIGLFYRDVYWRFDEFYKVPAAKKAVAKFFYRYDLYKYTKLIDVLYLPSLKMMEYIPIRFRGKVEELPPAVDKIVENTYEENKTLSIFYVGGISKLYNIEKLFEAVSNSESVELTVCCRQKEWESSRSQYEKYLSDRIKIIHKSGEALEPYFKAADIFGLFFEPNEYRKFAMPVKLFEYLSYKKPIISTTGTATGDFVEKNNIGWTIEYSSKDLEFLLNNIKSDAEKYKSKIDSIEAIINNHTWEARVKKVEKDLA